ncbi:MAG TPA: helix-turn-helix transcriptional regulator [Clostridiales bacterium]|nr:helix-turn-helix transcriptional regulator [Clostridiales bacterium]
MEQRKIGSFLKELRKEKRLTQEQLAEKLNVSGRTVSRWETGSNMPDISLLVELAEFYEVSIPEIIDGERKSEKMDKETKEAVLKVAEYSNEEKRKMGRVTLVYFIVGIISIIVNVAMRFMEFPDTFWVGFLDGVTSGLPLAAMLLGILYVTEAMTKVRAFKLKLIGRK